MNEEEKKALDFNQYRAEKTNKKREEQFFISLEKIRAHHPQAPKHFLEAWKNGIMLVGVEFFNIMVNLTLRELFSKGGKQG